MVGARWGCPERLKSGVREVASPLTRLWCSCGRWPREVEKAIAEVPRGSLLGFTAASELHGQGLEV